MAKEDLELARMGEWIHSRRLERRYTMDDVARLASVNKTTVRRLERGLTAKLDTMKVVADALEVSLIEMVVQGLPGDPGDQLVQLTQALSTEDLGQVVDTQMVNRLLLLEAENQFLRKSVDDLTAIEESVRFLQRQRVKAARASESIRSGVSDLGPLLDGLSAMVVEWKERKELENPDASAADILGVETAPAESVKSSTEVLLDLEDQPS